MKRRKGRGKRKGEEGDWGGGGGCIEEKNRGMRGDDERKRSELTGGKRGNKK